MQNLPPGSVPTVSEGVVSSTACINQVKRKRFEAKMDQQFLEQDRECCVGELDIGVRNCSSWVAYRSTPILIQHKFVPF